MAKLLDNRFFMTNGIWSKTAFICVVTWVIVLFKYLVSGLSLTYTKTSTVVTGILIPASSITYAPSFDMSGSIGLLTLVFGLYFSNKFAPPLAVPPVLGNASQERKDITADADQARKEITADAATDRKNVVEEK